MRASVAQVRRSKCRASVPLSVPVKLLPLVRLPGVMQVRPLVRLVPFPSLSLSLSLSVSVPVWGVHLSAPLVRPLVRP